jgi:hypothetical protein
MSDLTIQEEIAGLADLDRARLRASWIELYGSEAPLRMSRELLIQAVAHRLQVKVFGGLSSGSRASLASSRMAPRAKRLRIDRSVKSGTRFVREWQGRTIEVICDGNGGYLCRGHTYTSLSAVARDITGTRWSGPAFFGLTAAARERDHDRA